MNENPFPVFFLVFFGGAVLGALIFFVYNQWVLGGFKKLGEEILARSEQEAKDTKRSHEIILKQKQLEQQKDLEQLWQIERKKIQREDERLKNREDKLEERLNLLEKKLADVEKREVLLAARKEQLDEEKNRVTQSQANLIIDLEKTSGLSANEAREMLLSRLSANAKTDAAHLIRRIKKEAEEKAETEARRIITTSINRLAVACATDISVCTVSLPNEEMKGRIIGREGRNIRTLESLTGVNFIIDDTPGAVVLSGFDPIRKQVAKMALTDMIQDGRIHPTSIEEAVNKAQVNLNKQIKQLGEAAALRAGAINLHPELIQLLGKLKFRFSFGQNVLDHSLEVSYLMGLMAAELGLDVRLAKRIGLLHDIGKALTHEIEGSHAIIGQDVALRLGETKEVANGIGCHHGEILPTTIEADLCSAADAISASREGARSEAVEEYIKRLKKLEEMAYEISPGGIEKAYAMQAGRELRIYVSHSMIDDEGVDALAKDLSKRIELELRYPGKIKVTAIREKRAVVYAV